MMEPVLNVTVGGIRFEGSPSLLSGFVIGPDGLTGWDESTPGREGAGGDRPNAHGSFDPRMYRSGRSITLTGHILAENPLQLEAMKLRLTSILSEGEKGRLEVERVNDTLWAFVRVTSARAVDLDGRTASFIVQMVAADPRRYGTLTVFGPGSSVSVNHRGNTHAIPTIVVTGSMPSGYAINGPGGKQYRVTQGLAAGQTHEIRMRNGWLYRDGDLQFGAVSRAQIWTIPPYGNTTISLDPVSGSGQIQVRVRKTIM